jgi:predicted site-specific integrase-resolvase
LLYGKIRIYSRSKIHPDFDTLFLNAAKELFMKCLIYTRVSTDWQTPENQIAQLKEYAAKQDWQLVDVKVDICSGNKSANDRTGLKSVFEMARQRKFDVLLFGSLDRFSREGWTKNVWKKKCLSAVQHSNGKSVKRIITVAVFPACVSMLRQTVT